MPTLRLRGTYVGLNGAARAPVAQGGNSAIWNGPQTSLVGSRQPLSVGQPDAGAWGLFVSHLRGEDGAFGAIVPPPSGPIWKTLVAATAVDILGPCCGTAERGAPQETPPR